MDFINIPEENNTSLSLAIPKITTRQTEYLRDQYPNLSHLEAGNIAEWLQERKDQLFEQARTAEAEADTTRVLGLASAAIGTICYAVNPFMLIGGLVGGAAWLWFITEHYNRTKEIAPLPFVRGNFLDALARAGDFDARQNYQANHLADTVKFLPRHEAEEYTFLYNDFNFEKITEYLTQVESGKRFYAYRWLFGWFGKLKGKQLPAFNALSDHLQHVTVDSRVKVDEVRTIQSATSSEKLFHTETVDIRQVFDKPGVDVTALKSADDNANAIDDKAKPVKADSKQLPDEKLLTLPLKQRAIAIIDALNKSGFDLAKCIQDQITVIAGNQRGGKGTLMAILAILSKALEPSTKIHYFTAGDDVYPFKCDRLVCRLSFPKLDGTDADKRVAQALFSYLKAMDNATQGEYDGIILVIDEAVALSGYLDADQKEWMIKYLLTRASKKGAQIFVVLHGKYLSTWVGKNTNGMADTFKSGVSFIGCESTSIQVSTLKKISVATGRYFLADPEAFDKSIKDGAIGMIPDWMKVEKHPINNQPDPARTLLSFFPELVDDSLKTTAVTESDSNEQFEQMDTITQLESLLSLEAADVEVKEEVDNQFLNHVIVIISTSSQPVSFNAIRISKFWERNWNEKLPGTSKLRKALSSLIETEKLTGNEKDGYTLTNKN